MKFSVDQKVIEKFPNIIITIPIIMGFDNTRSENEALEFLRKVEDNLRKEYSLEALWKDKRIAAYLGCFRQFGVDPEKYVPAHAALASRVLGGKNLPDINPMVNLYNAMSIKYLTPFGGEDLDTLYGDFVLKFAQGGEQWISIGGRESKPAQKGELVWGDDYDLSTRALNWRQCNRTKMTQTTQNGYFIMDGFSDVNNENIQKAAQEFIEVAIKLFGGKATVYYLDAKHPNAEVPFVTMKMEEESDNGIKRLDNQSNEQLSKKSKRQSSIQHQDLLESLGIGQTLLEYVLQTVLYQAINNSVDSKTVISCSDVEITHPAQKANGDFSTNIAMMLSGRLKLKPIDLAQKIKLRLGEYIKLHQSISSIYPIGQLENDKSPDKIFQTSQDLSDFSKMSFDDIVEKIEVAGPGFINIWLRKDYLITLANKVLKSDYSVKSSQMIGKKIAVEYTDPNPFKEFHLGHMYSNFIGESISRIFEACGAIVWRGDFYGDVGMHVAKSVWGMRKKIIDQKINIKDLEKLPINARQKFLGEGYAMGVKKYEEDKKIQEEIQDINYLIYVAAQEMLKKDKGWKQIVNYRQYIKGKEKELEKIRQIYEAGLRWSLEYFETIYKRLGTKFDGYYPESWVGEYGMQQVQKGLKMDVLEKSEGGVVYRGEQDGLHTRVFVNKLGLPTYEAKDLGLAYAKYQDFKYDLSINVFGKEIDEYYKVVRAAMKKIEPELGGKAYHIAHGMVRLPAGKMSSRTGNVITFEGLLDEAKKRALSIMKDVDVEESEKQHVADKVALGAVKYALLKGSPGNDVVFDFDKSVSFDGDSGPYLQYTYARCRSVLRKAQKSKTAMGESSSSLQLFDYAPNPEEMPLLRTFYRFPEVISEAGKSLSPNLLCSYLFDLAQQYNLFYNKHSILTPDADNPQPIIDFRLFLTQATASVIQKGLYLLGIETVERM